MNTKNYDTESELMKFAAWNIQQNSNGPVLAQNTAKSIYCYCWKK